ncbi:hypothetical protein LSF16_04540, partial [Bacillus cereus]
SLLQDKTSVKSI